MKPTAFLALVFCCLAFFPNGSPAGKGLWLDVGSEFFQGPDDSFFGRWDKIDRLIISLEYSF